ncbi:MAG TPA: DUF2299 family protein [Verrucomicrobiae bacterium]|jgi:hypothetical protein|nr:DUF2299 family protein [Candidatus Sulfopaludibacter sp.]HXT85043.1 DUF2299 family protein [Verrucomicrobiae bacterium]
MLDVSAIEKDIIQWMTHEQWSFDKIDDPNFYFVYTVTIKNDKKILIGIEKTVDRLTIQNSLLIPENLRQSYRLSTKKYDFFYELKVHLMIMEIYLDISPNIEEIKEIHIAKFVYMDEFSRNKFIHSIMKLADATDLCIIMWKRFTNKSVLKG